MYNHHGHVLYGAISVAKCNAWDEGCSSKGPYAHHNKRRTQQVTSEIDVDT